MRDRDEDSDQRLESVASQVAERVLEEESENDRQVAYVSRYWLTLGTRAQIPTGYMVKTLRSQSTCDSNMPSDQMLSTF